MASLSKGTSFTDGVTGDVTAAKLHALVDAATPVGGFVTDRTAKTSVVGADLMLISDSADSNNLKKVSITNLANNLPTAVITTGTIDTATLGTTTGTLATFTSATITTGTITTGVIPTLTSTTLITSGTGTASAPAIVPTGDTNTGLFFPAADTIAFAEGGAEAVRINSSGNLILTSGKSLINYGAGGITSNSAIGSDALQANTTGFYNTANGVQALYSNTTGDSNTANGIQALYSNTTGNNNTANGREALYSNTTGNNNTAKGIQALYSNTTGNNNTANGRGALYSNTTGNTNTACGFHAGYGAAGVNANTTGSNNVFLGNTAVGTSSTASNVITLGNSAIATLRCQQTSISSLSDRRDKKDIVSLASGLSLIQELRPVSFVWDMRSKAKVGQPEIGFIAQELQEAQAKSGLSVPHLVNDDNPEKLEAAPATLIPILVKAVQELSDKVNELEAKLQGA